MRLDGLGWDGIACTIPFSVVGYRSRRCHQPQTVLCVECISGHAGHPSFLLQCYGILTSADTSVVHAGKHVFSAGDTCSQVVITLFL